MSQNQLQFKKLTSAIEEKTRGIDLLDQLHHQITDLGKLQRENYIINAIQEINLDPIEQKDFNSKKILLSQQIKKLNQSIKSTLNALGPNAERFRGQLRK